MAVGEATIVQAKASIAQAQAQLQSAQRNLSYCTIKSPVKGVIIDRRVNIGQTVVASLNAPSLFLLAKDLRRMQVWGAVNEADVGRIRPGQPVTFTVDAFPGETFGGEVGKVRLNASMTQNVVTYTVEVTTDNSSGTPLTYLTANVQFELSRRQNVLLVPNGALRWSLQPSEIAPEFRGAVPGRRQVLWIQQGAYVRPVKVTRGISDGTVTEVSGEEVREGMAVVLGESAPGGSPGGETAPTPTTTNPFTPQMGRARQGQRPSQ